ncbi:MAG: HPr(Ser) kinase/phosphatase [bacterium]
MDRLQVGAFFQDLRERVGLELANSPSGLSKFITQKNLHRPGLALAGFLELFAYDRVQVLGNTEIRFLESLSPEARHQTLERVLAFDIPCLVLSAAPSVPPELPRIAEARGICVFTSKFSSTELVQILSSYLDDKFAPSLVVHGSLVDVYGTGLLFTGRSGIGKSEIALDLIERGHRLVSDDVVMLIKKAEGVLMGMGSEMLKHFMEIRGVGIIDVRQMFGVRAIRLQKRVETEVELVDWEEAQDYERLGMEDQYKSYLDVQIPYVRLPIYPGKNITVIAESIALNLHLKVYGFHPARDFNRALIEKILDKKRVQTYLERDYE